MATIAQIARSVEALVTEEADRLGRETGFIQRQVKLSGGTFVQLLVFGVLANPSISYTDMSQNAALIGVPISAQGLAQRFTERAVHFLQRVLDRSVERVIAGTPATIPLLQRFNGVYIRDSSVISLPAELSSIWRGVGGSRGETAALKLQVRLNYSTGELDGPALQAGRQHDRTSPYQQQDEPVGSLELYDLGYFSLSDIQQRDQQGKYVVVRYKQGTALYRGDGTRLALLPWLCKLRAPTADIRVYVGSGHRIPMRLLVCKVPQSVADQRRRRLREYARKKQVPLKRETLALAAWTLVLTNVPEDQLSHDEALILLRVRWQIELLFKLWKHHALVDEWRSRNAWRILCELYAKLVGLVIMHWIFLIDWWRYPDRSLFKAAQVVQKLAIPAILALRDQQGLHHVLELFRTCLPTACRQNRRQARPAAFQLLLDPYHGGLA
jgi:hypothetical protein